MNHSNLSRARTGIRFASIASAAAWLLVACGGGGGGGGGTASAPEPTVSSVTASDAKYSQKVVTTVSGSNVNVGLSATSTACSAPMTLSTAPPSVSDASTAYYTCTANAVGPHTVSVTRSSDGAALGSANFNVPMPQVTMTLSNGGTLTGQVVLTLAPDKTPITAENFMRYVHDGFYPGTLFHRRVGSPNIAVQGGSARAPGATQRGVFNPIPLEVSKGLSNVQWSVAMARAGGNTTAGANSATSGFFINLANNSSFWDPHTPTSPGDDGLGYAVFGHVTSGSDVIAAMASAQCVQAGATTPPDCTPYPEANYVFITAMVQTQ
jgi:cyclophilin family peptidyl-prolyl cis-trans isomerase